MDERYIKNIGTFFSKEEQKILLSKKLAVIGCGGDGGYLLDFLIRMGFKKIIFFDGDNFEKSNLNRQIYCNSYSLFKNKAEIAYNNLSLINPTCEIKFYPFYFTEDSIKYLSDIDMIIDSADLLSYNTVKALSTYCYLNNIPYAWGRITQNDIMVKIITNKNNKIDFQNYLNGIKENDLTPQTEIASQFSYMCALEASLVCNELVKFFLNRPCAIDYFLKFNFKDSQIQKV